MAPKPDSHKKEGKDKDVTSGKDGKEAKSGKAVKASAKAQKAADEEARRQSRDMMLLIGSDESGDERDDDDSDARRGPRAEPAGVGPAAERGPPVDRFGNTLSKTDAANTAKGEELERARAEARARREAKASAAQLAAADEPPADLSEKRRADAAALRAKADAGGKLSSKEKRLLQQLEQSEAAAHAEVAEVQSGLAAFSISVRGATVSDGEVADQDSVSATDVIVPCFSVSAPSRALFNDASLRLASGRRYGLLGPNGAGKSTLLHLLAQRRLPVPSAVDVLLVQQEVAPSDVPVVEQVLQADARRAGLLEEERTLSVAMEAAAEREEAAGEGGALAAPAKGSAPAQAWTGAEWLERVRRLEALSAELDAIGADAAEPLARRILSGLGFDGGMQDHGSAGLSGGWRMRVSLARALFVRPALLLLDEPTNHLDLDAVLWLEEHLARTFRGTLLSVSHDVDFLSEVCTDLLSLDGGKLHHFGGSVHRYSEMRGQLEAKKRAEYAAQQKGLRELKAKGLSAEKAAKELLRRTHAPALCEVPRDYSVTFRFPAAEDLGEGAISVHELGFAYARDAMSGSARQLFSGLSFKLDGSSRVALVGPNGSGKSTLLKALARQLAPTQGEVAHSRRLRLGLYHQHFEQLLPAELSPLAFLRREYGLEEQDARKALGVFGLDGARHLIKVRELSGGQKARVVLASLSLQRPHILLLDEPTNHLDLESVEALVEGLKSFEGGVLLVSHDARLISALECELWVCGDGPSGLRVERRGFARYRADVLLEVERRAQLAAAEAERRAAAQRAARLERLTARKQTLEAAAKRRAA